MVCTIYLISPVVSHFLQGAFTSCAQCCEPSQEEHCLTSLRIQIVNHSELAHLHRQRNTVLGEETSLIMVYWKSNASSEDTTFETPLFVTIVSYIQEP